MALNGWNWGALQSGASALWMAASQPQRPEAVRRESSPERTSASGTKCQIFTTRRRLGQWLIEPVRPRSLDGIRCKLSGVGSEPPTSGKGFGRQYGLDRTRGNGARNTIPSRGVGLAFTGLPTFHHCSETDLVEPFEVTRRGQGRAITAAHMPST